MRTTVEFTFKPGDQVVVDYAPNRVGEIVAVRAPSRFGACPVAVVRTATGETFEIATAFIYRPRERHAHKLAEAAAAASAPAFEVRDDDYSDGVYNAARQADERAARRFVWDLGPCGPYRRAVR